MPYELSASLEPPAVRFGNRLLVRPGRDGAWEVCTEAECWPLNEQGSWRAVALLENSLEDVRAAFSLIGTEAAPLVQVVSAGLSMSSYWAGLAMRWVAALTDDERLELGPALRAVEGAHWADQKLKHAARRAARGL